MIHQHPVVARYMATFGAAMMGIDAAERAAIEQEIRSHIAEATAAGKPLEDVLEALGPAEALARAYAVELLMNPRNTRIRSVVAFLKLAATVVVASFATLIVATILGSVGITFTASGLAFIMVGMLETSGIHLPGVELNGVPPGWVVASGPLMIVIGLAAFVLLRSYIRLVGRAMRKRLPRAGNQLARA